LYSKNKLRQRGDMWTHNTGTHKCVLSKVKSFNLLYTVAAGFRHIHIVAESTY